MHSFSVGSKNARLGEMKSRLKLPIPDGFAITAWAYKHFIEANDLQKRISQQIDSLDIHSYEDLVLVGKEIRDIVRSSPVPGNLGEKIEEQCAELAKRSGSKGFALRSSAIGEDTLYSFAEQYASYLNVHSNKLVEYAVLLENHFGCPQCIE